MTLPQIFPDEYSNNRFWNFVKIGAPDECWLWQGPKKVHYCLGKAKIPARLVLFGITDYKNPLYALPTCGTELCVNPRHLKAASWYEVNNCTPSAIEAG